MESLISASVIICEAVLAENVKLKAQLAASTPSKRRRAE